MIALEVHRLETDLGYKHWLMYYVAATYAAVPMFVLRRFNLILVVDLLTF